MSRRPLPRRVGDLGALVGLTDVTAAHRSVPTPQHSVGPSSESFELSPTLVPVDGIRSSPYQPLARPSTFAVAAIRQAAVAAGGLTALTGWTARLSPSGPASTAVDAGPEGDAPPGREDRHPAYRELNAEGRALAELAADVATSGITTPLEARRVDAIGWELISGHRRLAAARLAGLTEVPVVSLGAVPDAEAATLVFARNRLRRDFGVFEEAQALATLRTLRQGCTVRELGAALGYSHGRAGTLLQIAATFDRALLVRLGGDVDGGAAAVSALSYRQLRELVKLAAASDALLTATRRATGLGGEDGAGASLAGASTAVDAGPDEELVRQRSRRGGGYVFTVARCPSGADPRAADEIAEFLEAVAARYRAAVRER